MMNSANGGVRLILILLTSPLLMLAVHMIFSRLRSFGSRQVVALKAALWGCLPTAVLLWMLVFRAHPSPAESMAVAYCLIVYGCLAYTYFHFFNMSETARRIRILCEISRAGSLSSEQMEALYKTTDVIDIRLERLVAMRQLKCVDGYYSIEGRTLYWAGLAILLWRWVLGFDRGFGEG